MPVESVILRVMLVPAARLTIQVRGLVVASALIVSIAGAETCPPGSAARMYGGTPPVKVRAAGSHSMRDAGVEML